jgi:hypothetical protein
MVKSLMDKYGYRTNGENPVITLIVIAGAGFRCSKKKKVSTSADLSISVPGTGFEPAHLTAPPPEDGASTNFATRAGL